MSSDLVRIADAVVDALRSATLSLNFTAERLYVPVYEVKDLVGLRVTVVPESRESTLASRGGIATRDHVVDVGLHKGIGRGPMTPLEHREACDPLMAFAEEIGDLFLGKALASYPEVRCMRVEDALIYDPAMLKEIKVFLCVLRLTFRTVR